VPDSPRTPKSIYASAIGEFLGSARVSGRRKEQAPRGSGPFRAEELLSAADLERLELDGEMLIYVE
jgi:hypothetical protein